MTDYRVIKTTQHEEGREQRVATFKVTQLIWLFLGLLEIMLAMRVVFKLVAVNAENLFASLLYFVTGLFVAPFASLTSAPALGNMVLEISTIIAMIVYLLIGWGLERIVNVVFYRPRGDVSVRQTMVSDNMPLQSTGVSQTTTTTDRSTTAPVGTNQTVVTESTHTQTPG